MINKDAILKLVSSPTYRPLKRKELGQKLKVPYNQKKDYQLLLKQMVREGTLIRIKSNRYALPSQVDLLSGTLSANEKGFGFVILEDEKLDDIFIPPQNMGTALDGDKVLIRMVERGGRRDHRGRKRDPEDSEVGQVTEVIERNPKPIVGVLAQTQKFYYVIPDNPKISHDIYVDNNELKKAKIGDKVVVKITHWESIHTSPEGQIVSVLGKSNEPWIDLKSILLNHGLSNTFPQQVTDEVAKMPNTLDPKEIKKRTDFRDEMVITIDPDDAKDFDDAISLKKLKNGHWQLGVHIADVSYYVRENTLLDKEAFQRGTSVYLPGKVIPMLPEKLSNNLCSLRPNETRFVKSVLAEFSADGSILNSSYHNGVIHSKKRFTYKEALEIVEKKNPQLRQINKEAVPTLDAMKELAELLLKRRIQRGSLLLDIPAVKIRVDKNGTPTSIEKETQDIAHTMIEEFMLVANELVAEHLTKRGFPCVFRVHAPPTQEALNDFILLVKSMGLKIPPVTNSRKIQQFLDSIAQKPEAGNIHYQLLRTLNRAEYAAKNIGHYALASNFYAHFTSPIRRYPDLMVHRYLNQIIQKEKKPEINPTRLAAMAKHCSATERTAQEAEYEAIDLKKLEFLLEQIKQKKVKQMKAIIRSIMPRGFFVETTEWLVDGFVPASSLTDDFYSPDTKKTKFKGQRTGKTFKVGQEIIVEPANIDLNKRQIDFKIITKKKKKTT